MTLGFSGNRPYTVPGKDSDRVRKLMHDVIDALFTYRIVTVDGRMYRHIQDEFQYMDPGSNRWINCDPSAPLQHMLRGKQVDVEIEPEFNLKFGEAFDLLRDNKAKVIEGRELEWGIPYYIRITNSTELMARDSIDKDEWSHPFSIHGYEWRVVE